MNAIVPINSHAEAYRTSTDAADMCKGIVVASAMEIQGRKYVKVEGWQAIAIAHGCTASARDVERVDGGFRAIGEVRRMDDGTVIAEAEGFVGEDEPTWFGGEQKTKWGTKMLPKRPDYAIRCMAQTRAISRACRSAFAHVVVMMNAGLSTTPAEEVPQGGFDDDAAVNQPHASPRGQVIDHEATQPNEPAPRTKLDGPHTSKTALRKAIVEIIAKVRAADSELELTNIQKENIATIKQANKDWPALLTGDPHIEEDVGLKGAIEARREELSKDDGQLSVMIESMKGCDTLPALTHWMTANEAAIDTLDDADRRKFEAAYEALEAGIMAMDKVSAGA